VLRHSSRTARRKGQRHANPKAKAQARTRNRIYAERRNGGHPQAHKAALTRQCSHQAPALQTQANVKVKGKGLRLSGVGSPTPDIQASKPPASRQIKGDLTAPGRQRQNQPPPARTPPAAPPSHDQENPSPPQARTGKITRTSRPASMASKASATWPPQPRLQRPARLGARTRHPKAQARQPKPGGEVRGESGTPAHQTGH
jgi:hypothetical protein